MYTNYYCIYMCTTATQVSHNYNTGRHGNNTGLHGNLTHTWEPFLNERIDLVNNEAKQQMFVQWAVGADDHALQVS